MSSSITSPASGSDGTIKESDLAALVDLGRHERTHVKVSAFYALGKKAASLHRSDPDDPWGPMTPTDRRG